MLFSSLLPGMGRGGMTDTNLEKGTCAPIRHVRASQTIGLSLGQGGRDSTWLLGGREEETHASLYLLSCTY